MSGGSWVQSPVWPSFLFNRYVSKVNHRFLEEINKRSLNEIQHLWFEVKSTTPQVSFHKREPNKSTSTTCWLLPHWHEVTGLCESGLVGPWQWTASISADWLCCLSYHWAVRPSIVSVKQKRWPDWGLNPGPSRHIPDALTTELSGLYQQIN